MPLTSAALAAFLMLVSSFATSSSAAGPVAAANPAAESTTTAATRMSEASSPPVLRLPAGVRPVRYALDLTLSPDSDTIGGVIAIDLALDAPLSILWLNATDLTIEDASLSIAGRTHHPRVVPGGDDFVGFAMDEPVGPGSAALRVSYTGRSSDTSLHGVFRQKEGGDWYLFTHFEPIYARKAFPCFDEPAFKVPWQIALRVKKELTALSNTPVVSETDAGGGVKVVRFAETQPLPSYLIAFGVGPFEFVEGPPVGSKKAPFRVVVPKGQRASAGYAVKSTPEILSLLEEYFGSAYPYEKLDLLTIPLGGGAMENPGLITFGRGIILSKPEDETLEKQRSFARVAAHELAHMWFGDLVTMKWWDDIWLNESFASWMTNKIIERWKPAWDTPADRVGERNRAMGADRLASARRIRQPIESKNDILNAFDVITYAKGSAVLYMFERWIGAERFQRGVRRHLSAHAWGNGDADGFFTSLSAEAGKDVSPAFGTFVDQEGVPIVTARVVCTPGSSPTLRVAQKRYLPTGSKGLVDRTWKIPVCVRYGASGEVLRQCTLLTEPATEIPIEGSTACPEWLLPNDGSAGYYLARLEADSAPPLARSASRDSEPLARLFDEGGKHLSVPERVGVLADLSALAGAGEVALSDVLSLLPSVIRDGDRHSLTVAADMAGGLRLNLVPGELVANYQRFVRKIFGRKARALGLAGKGKESEDTRLLRPILVSLVAGNGEDETLQEKARALSLQWLQDHRAVPAEMVDVILSAAARNGDEALFDRFHAAAKKASDRTDREHLLNAMASFRDRRIVEKRMPLVLADEFDAREARVLIWASLREPASREMAYAFTKNNYQALAARLPKEAEATFAYAGGGFCDQEHRADIEAFFGERTPNAPGGPRVLAQVLEQVDLCIAMKGAQQESVEAFLRKQ